MMSQRPALILAGLSLLAGAPLASAQSVISPYSMNPYARTSLGPYLNFSRGGDYDFRNPLLQPVMVVPEYLAAYDPLRVSAGRPELAPSSFEEWYRQREMETRFSPSGQPIGFMIYGPYHYLPYQNMFVPTAPTRGRMFR
jgi:hypothetical protein